MTSRWSKGGLLEGRMSVGDEFKLDDDDARTSRPPYARVVDTRALGRRLELVVGSG